MAFTSPLACKQYVTAGNSTLVVVSHKTGTHYTFNVKSSVYGGYYVKRVGQHNEHFYLGMIKADGKFHTTASSQFSDKGLVPFKWVWQFLSQDQLPPNCSISHDGKCGMCNRPLTDPESIEIGFGPVCRSKFIAAAC